MPTKKQAKAGIKSGKPIYTFKTTRIKGSNTVILENGKSIGGGQLE